MDDIDLKELESLLNNESYLLQALDELCYSDDKLPQCFQINLPELDTHNEPGTSTSTVNNVMRIMRHVKIHDLNNLWVLSLSSMFKFK